MGRTTTRRPLPDDLSSRLTGDSKVDWNIFENYVVDMLGLKKTKASGSYLSNGDGLSDTIMLECKWTGSMGSITLYQDTWDSARAQAFRQGRELIMAMGNPDEAYLVIWKSRDVGSSPQKRLILSERDAKIGNDKVKVISIINYIKLMKDLEDTTL